MLGRKSHRHLLHCCDLKTLELCKYPKYEIKMKIEIKDPGKEYIKIIKEELDKKILVRKCEN